MKDSTTTVTGPPGNQSVAVPLSWFTTAFYDAFGQTVSDVLRRLHADVSAVEFQFEQDSDLGLESLQNLRCRLSVAAEWAERLDSVRELWATR